MNLDLFSSSLIILTFPQVGALPLLNCIPTEYRVAGDVVVLLSILYVPPSYKFHSTSQLRWYRKCYQRIMKYPPVTPSVRLVGCFDCPCPGSPTNLLC
ncbi:hypothetical protein F4824DRAFT_442718, partial [Ustulina deusta]